MKKIKKKFPRVPLPRQRGGAHQLKTKVLDRKQKHKGQDSYWPCELDWRSK